MKKVFIRVFQIEFTRLESSQVGEVGALYSFLQARAHTHVRGACECAHIHTRPPARTRARTHTHTHTALLPQAAHVTARAFAEGARSERERKSMRAWLCMVVHGCS
jgi:hypothetical protein